MTVVSETTQSRCEAGEWRGCQPKARRSSELTTEAVALMDNAGSAGCCKNQPVVGNVATQVKAEKKESRLCSTLPSILPTSELWPDYQP